MPNYNVHVFAVVRVKVAEIEAGSQTEAIEKAQQTDFRGLFDREGRMWGRDLEGNSVVITQTEYAEELTHFHVDEIGDEDYAKSQWYCSDGKTQLGDRQCVSCLHVEESNAQPHVQ